MKRKLLVSAHLSLAAFFAPFLIVIATTGGLYLLGEKGTLRYTPIAHLEMQTLENQKRPLPEHLTALLQQAGVDNYTVKDIKISGDTIISYPSSRDYYQFTMNTTGVRSEKHTSELQSRPHLVCRLLLEKKKKILLLYNYFNISA